MLSNNCTWKFVKTEIHKSYYNAFIGQWLKERTSEIEVLDVSIDKNVERARLVLKNTSGFDVCYGLLDLNYYQVVGNCRKKRLADGEDYISVGFEIRPEEKAVIPLDLSKFNSEGLFLIRVVMTGENARYFIDLYFIKMVSGT